VEIPPLLLDRTAAVPLAVQLAGALRAATAAGSLHLGDRLPSTRALAAELRVSRTVTAGAYDQLLAEGWVAGRRGAGTFVVAVPSAPGVATRTPDADPEPTRISLQAGMPCVAVLDPAAWRRAWRAGADNPPDDTPDPVGLGEYRTAVVAHLLRHRGLPADPDAVLATAGSTAGVAELARILAAGGRVAVEEPGYRRAVGALRAAGLTVVPVAVDAEGLVVDALPAGLVAVVVTPAHQFPLGARLSAARRVALVARARAEGFLVVEDDYDGELRYDVAPLPLLAALGPDVVAHLGTASKLLTPTLGVGWLVAPAAVRDAVLDLRDRTGTRPAPAGQRVFAALAVHGDLGRHLRRLRRELADRRRTVLEAVGAAGREVRGDAAGAHVVVPLEGVTAERTVVAAAADLGVALDGLERFHTGAPLASGVVVGYAGPARDELDRALRVMAGVLRGT